MNYMTILESTILEVRKHTELHVKKILENFLRIF